jgi:archaetidylinositol phosphate synthase
MPSRYRLRRIFGPLVRKLARGFIALGVPPNVITVLGCAMAILATMTLTLWQFYFAYGLLVFITGLLDGVDGEVARATGRASTSGGFLDSMLDRLADVVLLLPFLYLPNPLPGLGPVWMWVFAAMTGCVLASYMRSRAVAARVADTDLGLGGRSERLFILVVASLLYYLDHRIPYVGLVLLTLLAHATVLYRIVAYERQLRTPLTVKPRQAQHKAGR